MMAFLSGLKTYFILMNNAWLLKTFLHRAHAHALGGELHAV